MIDFITREDIALVTQLSLPHYESLSLKPSVPDYQREELIELRHRLLKLSDFFKRKYDREYGAFMSENSTGNPVGRDGKLRRVWSGIFKGSENKQYSAQINFVINANRNCLDVGFYFGRVSAFGLDGARRQQLEKELLAIGTILADKINGDPELKRRYYELFELGFRAEIKNAIVTPEQWVANAEQDPAFSSVTVDLYPNSLGYIDMQTIDFYVSLIMPLIGIVPERVSANLPGKIKRKYALTPEQWAKRAERLALIGRDGEKYVMELERARLAAANISKSGYPFHTALEEDSAGYDILTCGPDYEDIYLEIKTTTMPRGHPWSKTFFLSSGEYEFYRANKEKYKLYRVWNVYGEPFAEEIDLENAELKTDGYMVTLR